MAGHFSLVRHIDESEIVLAVKPERGRAESFLLKD
jgi:hypothetical protein